MDAAKHELALHANRKGWTMLTIQYAEDYLNLLNTGQDDPSPEGLSDLEADEVRDIYTRLAFA